MPSSYDYRQAESRRRADLLSKARKRLLAAQAQRQPIPQGVSRLRPEGGFTSKPQIAQPAQPAPAGPNLTPAGVPASPQRVGSLDEFGSSRPTNIFRNRPKLMDIPPPLTGPGMRAAPTYGSDVTGAPSHPGQTLGLPPAAPAGPRPGYEHLTVRQHPPFSAALNQALGEHAGPTNIFSNRPKLMDVPGPAYDVGGGRPGSDGSSITGPVPPYPSKPFSAGEPEPQDTRGTIGRGGPPPGAGKQLPGPELYPGARAGLEAAREAVDKARGAAGGVKEFLSEVGNSQAGQYAQKIINLMPPNVVKRLFEGGGDAVRILLRDDLTPHEKGELLMQGLKDTANRELGRVVDVARPVSDLIEGFTGQDLFKNPVTNPKGFQDMVGQYGKAVTGANAALGESLKGLFGGGDAMVRTPEYEAPPQGGPLQGPRQERFIERAARLRGERDAAGLALHEKNLKNMTHVDPRTGERVRNRSAARGVSRRTGPMTRKELAYNQEQQKFALGNAAIARQQAQAQAAAAAAAGKGGATNLSSEQMSKSFPKWSPTIDAMKDAPNRAELFAELREFNESGEKGDLLLAWENENKYTIPDLLQ